MRRESRWLPIVACVIALLGAAYGVTWRYGRRPAAVSVDVIGRHFNDDSLIISLVATNTGHTPLVCYGNPPFREVRVRTDHGWTNVTQTYLSQRASIGFLLPGRSQTYSVTVPRNITGFQVSCYFETAGAKTLIAGRLMEKKWLNRLYPILGFTLSLLPDGKGDSVKFSTQVIDVRAIE